MLLGVWGLPRALKIYDTAMVFKNIHMYFLYVLGLYIVKVMARPRFWMCLFLKSLPLCFWEISSALWFWEISPLWFWEISLFWFWEICRRCDAFDKWCSCKFLPEKKKPHYNNLCAVSFAIILILVISVVVSQSSVIVMLSWVTKKWHTYLATAL